MENKEIENRKTTEKINSTKSWFFVKIKLINLYRMIRKEKERHKLPASGMREVTSLQIVRH